MLNWKTTLLGLTAALMLVLQGPVEQLGNGQPVDWFVVLQAVAIAVFGYFAKDKDVTGDGK